MRRWIAAAAVAASISLFVKPASAHRIDEYLQATILSVGGTRVDASMRLIPGIAIFPMLIAAIDANADGIFSEGEERAYVQRVLGDLSITSNGVPVLPRLLSFSFPQPDEMREGLGEIHIVYAVEITASGPDRTLVLANHHLNQRSVYLVNVIVPEDRTLHIMEQRRNQQQSIYEVDYEQAGGGSRSLWRGAAVWMDGLELSNLFHLGMRHIAEGTDHLLFLLTLLLPAPLLAAGRGWGVPASVRASLLRILGIVTAFTVGHSITLTLAAFGVVYVSGRPVEVLIAASILVSAVHALRPIVPGREALFAGFFGLIHGLAFAATLDKLGLSRWDRAAGVLAFNVGIESMQMIVVALVLPSLILLSRTRAYGVLRVGGGVLAVIASLGWMVERVCNVETPVDGMMNGLARHAVGMAGLMLLVSAACWFFEGLRLPISASGKSALKA